MIDPFVNSALIVATTAVVLIVVFLPKVVNSRTWRATVTPLASIIGSGFLVLGPILKHSYGVWAPAVMLGLCLMAYGLGAAIRFNIRCYETAGEGSASTPPVVPRLEIAAGYALIFAYVISIAYYLNLFGEFAVSLTPADDRAHARLVTTLAFVVVTYLGRRHGFRALERIEEGAVGLKLAIIAGLLVGFALYFIELPKGSLPSRIGASTSLDWNAVFVALGLVITVQGFETSRYLGSEFSASERIRTMKLAQWIAAGIYLFYIVLVTVCFTGAEVPDNETGIIQMTSLVAPVLPLLLVTAALAAQLSAAVADMGGCGGLTGELTHKRLASGNAYLLIAATGIAITWVTDVYSLIAYASRAFAVYYAIQSGIAAVFAIRRGGSGNMARACFFVLLTLIALCIVIFGKPAE